MRYAGMEENLLDNRKKISLRVRNNGNLTDVGKVYMYIEGIYSGEMHHFELDPDEEKVIHFDLENKLSAQDIALVMKYKNLVIDN